MAQARGHGGSAHAPRDERAPPAPPELQQPERKARLSQLRLHPVRSDGVAMSRGRERVVALVDMDCFFMQVEQRFDPRLRGRPCAVVQYNQWQGGG